jgi:hypothetical protein
MKNVLRVLIVAAFITAFASVAFAQDAAATPAQGGPCTTDVDAKAALYKKFLDNYKGTPDQQKVAYETGKEYLSKYGTCPDAGDAQIAKFIQGWSSKYEAAVEEFACNDAFNKKNYAGAFQACQVIIAKQPDNIDKILLLARAGYLNATLPTPNKALYPESAKMARRAAELIESGKAPADWKPFPNKDEALGFLYYGQGVFTYDTDPTVAVAAFVKAAQSNSLYKNEASTYIYIANVYELNELVKLVNDYKAAFPPNVPIPDEKKPQYDQMLAQIGRVQDRIIDSLARAVALMKADPKADQAKLKGQMTRLTNYYKARHEDKEDGLPELISNVMSKPLMLPGQEPAPTPPPSTSSSVSGTDGSVKPTTPPATQPAATNGAKPAATPAPANGAKPAPKPRTK